jgi:hypothetical protein
MTDNEQKRGQQASDKETERRNRENETGQQADKQSAGGFVGTGREDTSDYLTKEPRGEGQDFAEQGQGAQDTSAGKSDIETEEPTGRDAILDDGSSNR